MDDSRIELTSVVTFCNRAEGLGSSRALGITVPNIGLCAQICGENFVSAAERSDPAINMHKDCGRHEYISCRIFFFKWCATHDDCDCEESPFRRFLSVLVAFLLIVLLVILVIFVVLHPHKPRFYLQNAPVHNLNLTGGLLTSNLQFNVVLHNPNDRIGVLYDSLSIYASYLDQQITLQYLLPPFYQGDTDINVLTPLLCGNSVSLAPLVYENLNYERLNGLVSLSLRIAGTIRWKVGSWTSGHYHLSVNCLAILTSTDDGVGDQGPLQLGTRCHLQV